MGGKISSGEDLLKNKDNRVVQVGGRAEKPTESVQLYPLTAMREYRVNTSALFLFYFQEKSGNWNTIQNLDFEFLTIPTLGQPVVTSPLDRQSLLPFHKSAAPSCPPFYSTRTEPCSMYMVLGGNIPAIV